MDIGGDERKVPGVECYYRGADCAMIMCESLSEEHLKTAYKWYKSITRHCPNIPILLIHNNREISTDKRDHFLTGDEPCLRKQKGLVK